LGIGPRAGDKLNGDFSTLNLKIAMARAAEAGLAHRHIWSRLGAVNRRLAPTEGLATNDQQANQDGPTVKNLLADTMLLQVFRR